MSKREKKGLVPALRFPEFRDAGEWPLLNGNKVFDQISNKNHNSDLPILAITQEHGAIPREKIDYQVSVTDKSVESYKVVEPGDYIISLRSFQGGIEYSTYKGLCSPAYVILREKIEIDKLFFKQFFKTNVFIQSMNRNIEGIRDGKMVSYKQFSDLLLPIPSIDEQQKIADCLTSVDELITAQAQKIDTLKAHKKGLMQQLFPEENETVPKLRFPDFRGAGEWESKQLSELLFETKHRNRQLEYGPQDVLSVSGEYGCVNQIEFKGRSYAGVSVKDYHVVQTGDIVYTKSPLKNNPFGIIKENKGKTGIVSTLYAVYRVTDMAHPAYLDQYFSRDFHVNSYLQPIVNKGAKNDMKVNNSDVLSGKILIPKKEEQQKIAECLTSIDELITSQSKKVDALKAHKKGLMQQLFPTMEVA